MRRLFNLMAIVLVVATPSTAQLSTEAGVGGTLLFERGTALSLYEQTDDASGDGSPDQDFEAAFDVYDSEAADDFEVDWPDGWIIEQVDTVGSQSDGGSLTSVDLWFYADNGGLPDATPICEYLGLPSAAPDSLTLDISGDPCVLPAGVHWLAIQVNQDAGGGNGQHFWSNRTSATGNPGVWRNPGDGFGTGCTDWAPQTTCGVGGGTNPDFLFALSGQLGEPDVVIEGIPTIDATGLVVLALLLGGGAMALLRRRHTA